MSIMMYYTNGFCVHQKTKDLHCLIIGHRYTKNFTLLVKKIYTTPNSMYWNILRNNMNTDKFEFLKKEINKLLKKEVEITLDTVLLDIGLDSLDIVELQMVYEETFNVELKDIEHSMQTVADLICAIEHI